jgi:hypothetical protein
MKSFVDLALDVGSTTMALASFGPSALTSPIAASVDRSITLAPHVQDNGTPSSEM